MTATKNATFQELIWLHNNSYGSALKIPKKILQAGFIILCIVTPFTNWAIPFAKKIKSITVRW